MQPAPSDLTATWQARLDAAFPRGVIAAFWPDPARIGYGPPPGFTYQIPRILVLKVGNNGQPVVLLPAFSGSDKVLGPLQVLTYEQLHAVPRLVKVSFEGEARVMTWTSVASRRLAKVMAPEREAFMKLAPHGGRAAQHTPLEP